MANITRFDPLSDLVSFAPFRNFDDFFRTPRIRALAGEFPAEPEIKMDVSEDDKAYHVKAEIQLRQGHRSQATRFPSAPKSRKKKR